MNDGSNNNTSPVRWPLVAFVLLLSTGASTAWLYQQKAEVEWSQLPPADGSLEASERRLAALEEFIGSHPIWLGAHEAISEKTELSTRVERMRTERAVLEAAELAERTMQSDAADSARLRGTRLAESGDFEGALAHFREALEIAPEDWADREEVEHEVTAFEEHLANAPESAPEEEQQ